MQNSVISCRNRFPLHFKAIEVLELIGNLVQIQNNTRCCKFWKY